METLIKVILKCGKSSIESFLLPVFLRVKASATFPDIIVSTKEIDFGKAFYRYSPPSCILRLRAVFKWISTHHRSCFCIFEANDVAWSSVPVECVRIICG